MAQISATVRHTQLWPITRPKAKACGIESETDTVTQMISLLAYCTLKFILIGLQDIAAQAPHLHA